MLRIAFCFFFTALVLSAQEALVTPIWKGNKITQESLFFIKEPGNEAATSKLLFTPTSTPILKSSTGETSYEEGKDFVWKKGSKEISLTSSSRIPFKDREALYPAVGSSNTIAPALGRDGKGLLFGEGAFYHYLQADASYKHREKWTGFTPQSEKEKLPRTLGKIKNKQPVRITVLGDSISTGANASGATGAKPLMPPYPALVAQTLQAAGAGQTTVSNLSVGGQISRWGISRIPDLLKTEPDLVIIAFGMNDAGGISPDEYSANHKKMISEIQAARPDTEIVLVSTMIGNPEWPRLKQELFPKFQEELRKLTGPGVALADVSAVWSEVMKRKGFHDLTGNGVNHPNDFGHRIYAQTILALFGLPKK